MTSRKRVAIAVVAAVAVALIGAVVGRGARRSTESNEARSASTQPERRVTQSKHFGRTVTVEQIDRRRGLRFKLDSDQASGGLEVTMTPGAPASTRSIVLSRPLAATCDAGGRHVREFGGRWDRKLNRFGTALLLDDPSVQIADVATSCALYIGREGETPDAAYFDGPPFSRVRMR